MNGPIDEKSFDEYLQRGSPVSQQYRALDGDEVPSELDERILGRATDAVRSSNEKARKWRRWSVPVALAASTVLVVSVVLEGVRQEAVITRAPVPSYADDELRESSGAAPQSAAAEAQQPDSAPTEKAPAPPPPARVVAPAPSVPRAQTQAQPARGIEDEEQVVESVQSERPEAPNVDSARMRNDEASDQAFRSSAQRQADPDAEADMSADNERRLRAAAPPRALSGSGLTGNSSAAYEASAMEARRTDTRADQWLERIRVLRENGKIAEADREWQAFRKTYPDHPVAEDDIARPEREADSG